MAQIIVLMGPQGAGKGTQAAVLAENLSLPIIATGDILREVAKTDTDLGRQVRQLQEAGQLVPDAILAEIIKDRTAKPDSTNGYILDGFPRTVPQAKLLDEIAREQGHTISAIEIDVPRELLWKRLTGRRTCRECGAIYNIYFKPSAVEGVCDLDGHELFTRSDDNEESIAKRLALYDEKTRPILDYYSESGRLSRVNGAGGFEEVFSGILNAVGAKANG